MNTTMNTNYFCSITPEIARLAELNRQAATIDRSEERRVGKEC